MESTEIITDERQAEVQIPPIESPQGTLPPTSREDTPDISDRIPNDPGDLSGRKFLPDKSSGSFGVIIVSSLLLLETVMTL